jgi:NAD(P)-dependent dehydrogenase (short-subunit alcohol dehydrogenase family)
MNVTRREARAPVARSRRRGPLAGEVAIVTGASSGIGTATASALAARGARVVLAARRAKLLDAAQEAISASGGSALAVATDVSDPSQLTRLVDRAHEAFGRVDILVNNAGANWRQPLVVSSPDKVRELLEVNLVGAVMLTRLVLPGMLERGHGSIISVGSLSGRVAMEPVYSASKYGLRGFSLALRRQLGGTGVSVSLVSPGNIRTGMTSHVEGRLPEPGVVAGTICGLVARPRREVVVPGRHYAIAWLEELCPRLADVAHRRRGWSPVRQGARDECDDGGRGRDRGRSRAWTS